MEGRLFALVQDTLRGSAMDRTGLYDSARIRAMLDAIPAMDEPARTAVDPGLMWMTSMCLLHGRRGS